MRDTATERRLNAIKKKFFFFGHPCACCKDTVKREEMWYVDRWGVNKNVYRWYYCTKCMKSKEEILKSIETDECYFGIAFVDDFNPSFANKTRPGIPGQTEELRNKQEKISTDIFIQLSKNEEERIRRIELVKKYGGYSNVTFFSDGSVHVKSDGKGATGWLYAPSEDEEYYTK